MLLALDSTDPPAEHDGIYPRDALLAANASVPILWLSLFDADGLVTWPGIHGSAFRPWCSLQVNASGVRAPGWGSGAAGGLKCSGTCPGRG